MHNPCFRYFIWFGRGFASFCFGLGFLCVVFLGFGGFLVALLLFRVVGVVFFVCFGRIAGCLFF